MPLESIAWCSGAGCHWLVFVYTWLLVCSVLLVGDRLRWEHNWHRRSMDRWRRVHCRAEDVGKPEMLGVFQYLLIEKKGNISLKNCCQPSEQYEVDGMPVVTLTTWCWNRHKLNSIAQYWNIKVSHRFSIISIIFNNRAWSGHLRLYFYCILISQRRVVNHNEWN